MAFVYKYVLDGEVIYIGKTINLDARIRQHARPGDNIPPEAWPELRLATVYYFETPTETMADVIESEMIRRHLPKWNRAKKSAWDGLHFPEPEFREYIAPALYKRGRAITQERLQEIMKVEAERRERRIKKYSKELSKLRDSLYGENLYTLHYINWVIRKVEEKDYKTDENFDCCICSPIPEVYDGFAKFCFNDIYGAWVGVNVFGSIILDKKSGRRHLSFYCDPVSLVIYLKTIKEILYKILHYYITRKCATDMDLLQLSDEELPGPSSTEIHSLILNAVRPYRAQALEVAE